MEEKPKVKPAGTESSHSLDEPFRDALASDAAIQFMIHNVEGANMDPAKFFVDYFRNVRKGTHVLFREFSFIVATPYNRLCVLKYILKVYKPLVLGTEILPAKEYHSLLKKLWPDFPFQIIAKVFESIEGANPKKGVRFLEFIAAFRKFFCLFDVDKFTHEEKKLYLKLRDKEELFVKVAFEKPLKFDESDVFKYISVLAKGRPGKPKEKGKCKSNATSESAPSSNGGAAELQKLDPKGHTLGQNRATSDADGQLAPSFSNSRVSSKSKQVWKITEV